MPAALDFLFRVVRSREESIPFHRHRCYELVYYVSGHGLTRIGPKEWPYSPGSYALIRPFTQHDERRRTTSDIICVGFSPDADAAALPEGVFAEEAAELLPLLERMLSEMQAKRPRYSRMLDALSEQLALELERRLPDGDMPEEGDHFQYTLNFMNEHYTQKIDFASLSALAGYSYDRYRHLFKERTGLSPMQYVMAKRMELAKRLLQQTKLTVSAIAMECGFANDAQFCNVFKREHGQTPGAFRENGERREGGKP